MLQPKEALARAFESRTSHLVDAWDALGEDGPSGGDEALCRARYLAPLARLLIGALRGSVAHEAVYLDERTRYLPSRLDARTRSDLMLRRLEIETKILGKALLPKNFPAVPYELSSRMFTASSRPAMTRAQIEYFSPAIAFSSRRALSCNNRRATRASTLRSTMSSLARRSSRFRWTMYFLQSAARPPT